MNQIWAEIALSPLSETLKIDILLEIDIYQNKTKQKSSPKLQTKNNQDLIEIFSS